MIRRPPRSTQSRSSAASDVYKRQVLLDALGSAIMDRDQVDQMEQAGVEVRRFRPIRPYTLRRLANRSHRRVLVVDGQVGMTGGVGIAEEWTGDAQDSDHWRDTH